MKYQKKFNKFKKEVIPKYYIRSMLCSWITGVSVFALLAGSIVTIVFILYFRLIYWVDQVVTSSLLLNIEIMAEGAALNAQDTMQLNLNDLNIAKAFIEASLMAPPGLVRNTQYPTTAVVSPWDTKTWGST